MCNYQINNAAIFAPRRNTQNTQQLRDFCTSSCKINLKGEKYFGLSSFFCCCYSELTGQHPFTKTGKPSLLSPLWLRMLCQLVRLNSPQSPSADKVSIRKFFARLFFDCIWTFRGRITTSLFHCLPSLRQIFTAEWS